MRRPSSLWRRTCVASDCAAPVTGSITLPLFSPIGVPFAVLAYGENHYTSLVNFDRVSSIHAEDNAIRKLPHNPTHKRLKKVDILVIRTNNNGGLMNSKPCILCLMLLCTKLPSKGYSLCNVYYSTSQGKVESNSLQHLLFTDMHHMSNYDKNRGVKISLATL